MNILGDSIYTVTNTSRGGVDAKGSSECTEQEKRQPVIGEQRMQKYIAKIEAEKLPLNNRT